MMPLSWSLSCCLQRYFSYNIDSGEQGTDWALAEPLLVYGIGSFHQSLPILHFHSFTSSDGVNCGCKQIIPDKNSHEKHQSPNALRIGASAAAPRPLPILQHRIKRLRTLSLYHSLKCTKRSTQQSSAAYRMNPWEKWWRKP
jgi:hypothetical protein